MHGKLKNIQKDLISNMRNNLEILEVEDEKPIIITTVAMAEKPLSESEIVTRSQCSKSAIKKELKILIEKDIIVITSIKGKKGEFFEINPDIDDVLSKRIREKVKKVSKNNVMTLEKAKDTISEIREDLDERDRLYANIMFRKVKNLERINKMTLKYIQIFNFFGPGDSDKKKIKKITVT